MGNYKFKLSDMIPNSWFYKLRDMGKPKNQTTPHKKKKQQQKTSSASTTQHSSKPKQQQPCNPRKSYYFTRELNHNNTNSISPQPPRKSTKQRTRRRTTTTRACSQNLVNSSSVSAGCSCRTTLESVWTKSLDSPPEHSSSSSPPLFDISLESSEFPDPEFRTDRVLLPTESFDQTVSLHNNNDIVIDVDKNSLARKDDKLDGYDSFSELVLPPIITKPSRKMVSHHEEQQQHQQSVKKGSMKVKIVREDTTSMKEQRISPVVRGFSVSSPGVKIRINSPRISGKKVLHHHSHGRKSVSSSMASSVSSRRSLSGSFAIVKSSFNPQKDFRESMVEMIVENNIRASKDLEDLLACYLSLNSDEYHDLIIKVFKQIWFDLTETK